MYSNHPNRRHKLAHNGVTQPVFGLLVQIPALLRYALPHYCRSGGMADAPDSKSGSP